MGDVKRSMQEAINGVLRDSGLDLSNSESQPTYGAVAITGGSGTRLESTITRTQTRMHYSLNLSNDTLDKLRVAWESMELYGRRQALQIAITIREGADLSLINVVYKP